MLKATVWIGVVSAPILLASAGCSIGLRPHSTHDKALPPERLMSMARTFERQGHLAQAKNAYLQVLTARPDFPNARQNLDTLIASEMKRNGTGLDLAFNQPIRRSSPTPEAKAAPDLAVRHPASPVAIASESPSSNRESLVPQLPVAPTSPAIVVPIDVATTDFVESTELIGMAEPDDFIPPEPTNVYELPISVTQYEIEDLAQFLGPFHVDMVRQLKENREVFQLRLVELALDREADIDLRSRAVFLLGAIGPDAIESIPMLRRGLNGDGNAFLKVDLSESILKIHPEDEDAIAVLVGFLKDSDLEVQRAAAFALRCAVSPRTKNVIDALHAALRSDDLKLRRMIFLTLAEFGPAAARVVPELETALDSPDPATREVARASLACIAPDHKTVKIQNTAHERELVLTD